MHARSAVGQIAAPLISTRWCPLAPRLCSRFIPRAMRALKRWPKGIRLDFRLASDAADLRGVLTSTARLMLDEPTMLHGHLTIAPHHLLYIRRKLVCLFPEDGMDSIASGCPAATVAIKGILTRATVAYPSVDAVGIVSHMLAPNDDGPSAASLSVSTRPRYRNRSNRKHIFLPPEQTQNRASNVFQSCGACNLIRLGQSRAQHPFA